MLNDILVIDDEVDIRELICDILSDEGLNTRQAHNSEKAFELINECPPAVVILDIWLEGSDLDGLGILEVIKRKYQYLPVIMISGHGTIETAVSSIKLGAYDYIEKPFGADKLLITVKRALEMSHLALENAELKNKIRDNNELIGKCAVTTNLRQMIDKIAPTVSRVLIKGSNGSGKELIARLIHSKSKRRVANFIKFNPIGLSEQKINDELFGQLIKSGINDQPRIIGAIEKANGGTLFIQEITELPINLQNKLLRFLQDPLLLRTNSNEKTKLDIRIITATTKDILRKIKEKKFSQDLYYRLNVIPIEVPSLNERKEDIPLLCEYFFKSLKDKNHSTKSLSQEALVAMQGYNWPGNIQQLKNTIEWLLIMTDQNCSELIKVNQLPTEIVNNNNLIDNIEDFNTMSMSLKQARETFEKRYLAAQMLKFNGNISKTSVFIGMERSALHRKLKLLNIIYHNQEDENVNYECS